MMWPENREKRTKSIIIIFVFRKNCSLLHFYIVGIFFFSCFGSNASIANENQLILQHELRSKQIKCWVDFTATRNRWTNCETAILHEIQIQHTGTHTIYDIAIHCYYTICCTYITSWDYSIYNLQTNHILFSKFYSIKYCIEIVRRVSFIDSTNSHIMIVNVFVDWESRETIIENRNIELIGIEIHDIRIQNVHRCICVHRCVRVLVVPWCNTIVGHHRCCIVLSPAIVHIIERRRRSGHGPFRCGRLGLNRSSWGVTMCVHLIGLHSLILLWLPMPIECLIFAWNRNVRHLIVVLCRWDWRWSLYSLECDWRLFKWKLSGFRCGSFGSQYIAKCQFVAFGWNRIETQKSYKFIPQFWKI